MLSARGILLANLLHILEVRIFTAVQVALVERVVLALAGAKIVHFFSLLAAAEQVMRLVR